MFTTLSTLLSFALLPSVVTLSMASSIHSRPRAVHNALAKRAVMDVQVYRRFSNTRWTFYDVGLGACGVTNKPSDWIVALNSIQFGPGYPGQHCFKNVVMTYNGKTATATIMDSCPGCPYGGLDLSRGLFSYFADQDLGVISGEWTFVDAPTPTPAPPPPPPPPPPTPMEPVIVTSAVQAADAIITKAKKKKSKTHTRTGVKSHTHSYAITTPWQIAAATSAPVPKKHAFHSGARSTSNPNTAAPSVTSVPHVSAHRSNAPTPTLSSASSESTMADYSTDALGNSDTAAELQSNIQMLSAVLLRFGELVTAGSFLGKKNE